MSFFRRACPRFLVALLLIAAPTLAQTKAPGGFTLSGDLSYRANTVRLDRNARGLARVQSPELDVRAQVIALDQAGKTVSEVRAQRGVVLKLNVTPRGATTPIRVEATCDDAVLTPRPFKLVLKGNLNGFYQLEGGPKTTLRGAEATLTSPDGNFTADLLGGPQGVLLTVPAETLGRPDAIGDLTITAQRARIDQRTGTATLIGNARAISKGGNAFDVSAAQFVLTRGADGSIATLQTSGRTLVKLDLPPDPTPPSSPATPVPGATTTGTPAKLQLGQPTHVEVAADGAIIERATSTATFNGNVKGFYRLSPATGAAQNYDFTGDKATIRYVATSTAGTAGGNALSGLSVQVTDASVEAPAFNFGF